MPRHGRPIADAILPTEARCGLVSAFHVVGWSSPVAREAHNLEVAGSNPAPTTRFDGGLPRGVRRVVPRLQGRPSQNGEHYPPHILTSEYFPASKCRCGLWGIVAQIHCPAPVRRVYTTNTRRTKWKCESK